MFLLFAYLVDGDFQLAKLFRRIVKGDDVLWDRQDTAKPRLLKLHTARHIALEHLVCHVAPVVRVADGCGGEADDLRFGIAFNNVLHALAPLGRSAMVELVGDYHITFRGGNFVPCRDHRCGICHKLQVLRCESGREISKVRHLVGEHVLVGAEQKESHLRIVLHKFGDDDKLAGAGGLHHAGAVAHLKHFAELVIGRLVVRVKFDLGIHVSCPFCP